MNTEARWLVALGSALNTATYLAYWLSAPYYAELGIPVVWFSSVLVIRNLWNAELSRRFTQERRVERNMAVYIGLAGSTYLLMATGQ